MNEGTAIDGLTEIQNTFSNLADEKIKAGIVVAIREDGELISTAYGNVETICLLTDTAKLIGMNKLSGIFKEG
jgi:hypothetical protein